MINNLGVGGTDLSKFVHRFNTYYNVSGLTVNVYQTVLNVNGEGFLEDCVFANASVTGVKNVHIKITVDDVVMFDKGITNTSSGDSVTHAIGIVKELHSYPTNLGSAPRFLGPHKTLGIWNLYEFNATYVLPSSITDGADISVSNGSDSYGIAFLMREPIIFKKSLKIEIKSSLPNVCKGIVSYATA